MKSSAIFALLLTACAFGAEGPSPGDDPKPGKDGGGTMAQNDAGSSDPDSATDDPDGGAGGISGGGTGIYSAMQMFAYINQIRQQYANHIPYDGYPFQGMNAQTMTWQTQLVWDANLAKQAQTEADRLAKGGQPMGSHFPFMNDGQGEGFDTWGLDSPTYGLATRASASLPQFKNAYGQLEPPHHAYIAANGFFRMGVAYQTGTGGNNKKSKLGVGAAEGGTNVTWWVLIFG
jgi:hypothetical protein